MEIDEIELEVSKNQISFDFDSLEEDEESSMLSNVVSAKNLDWIGQEVLFVVIKTYHDDVVSFLKVEYEMLVLRKKHFPYIQILVCMGFHRYQFFLNYKILHMFSYEIL